MKKKLAFLTRVSLEVTVSCHLSESLANTPLPAVYLSTANIQFLALSKTANLSNKVEFSQHSQLRVRNLTPEASFYV